MDEQNVQLNSNATPDNGGSISGNGDPVLKESDRKRLDGIVMKMKANKESDETIRTLVADFKQKYGAKEVKPEAVGASASTSDVKPTVSDSDAKNPQSDTNPQLKVGKLQNEGTVPERPTQYEGHPIVYGETDDSGIVDFGNGIKLPVFTLPEEKKNTKPTIQIGDYISSLDENGKLRGDITGQPISKDVENALYRDWEIKGWGKVVKTDETTGRQIFAPNEKGRPEIKKVYENQLGYDKPLKEEYSPLSDFVSEMHEKYGVLLTDEQRKQLGSQQSRVNFELDLKAQDLVKKNPDLDLSDAKKMVTDTYIDQSDNKSQEVAGNFIAERLSMMRWGREEDTAKEAEWLKSIQRNPAMLREFGQFLISQDGKAYTTDTNKFLSTMTQKDMKDVFNSFFQYKYKENAIDTQVNLENFKDAQQKLLDSAKSGNVEETNSLLTQLQESQKQLRINDTQAKNIELQQKAINEVFTEANYWENKAGQYYGEVENGDRKLENVINGASTMAVNAVKRTAGGILSVFLSPMTMMGEENSQDYYDLVKALGKPLEMKGVKLHDAFYSQDVGHDKGGVEYVRLSDGKMYQRQKDGTMAYLEPDEYDINDIKWDKTEKEWSASGIANAVQSFGWDVYLAGVTGNALTKPIAALSEYTALSNATRNLAKLGTAVGEESAVTEGLVNFTKALRSPHAATNTGFFAQMYQDNLIKAKDAGIESDFGAAMYATLNSAFDSFLISKVVPEFKMKQLGGQANTIVRNLAENKLAAASQGMYGFLKETAPSMAHTYLTMLAIETKTKLTDKNLNDLTDSHFHLDNSESIFTSSAKGALPLVIFSMLAKSPMMMNRNKMAIEDGVADLSKMDRDELMVSLARQGDHIYPMLKAEAQNAYFKSYANEVEKVAENIQNKERLIKKVPQFETYNDKDLTQITDLLELKEKKENELSTVDDAFKKPIKKDIDNLTAQIEEIVNKNEKGSTTTKTGPQKNNSGPEGQTNQGETEDSQKEYLLKDEPTLKRLRDAGVSEDVIAALPANLRFNDRYLMGDKNESLLSRLNQTAVVGGRSHNTIEWGDAGEVVRFENGRIDLNKILGTIYNKDKHNTFHEAVHGATVLAMEDMRYYMNLPEDKRDGRYTLKEANARANLDFYADYLRDKVDEGEKDGKGQNLYGLTNGFEFVAEYMSNPKFREWVLNTENERVKQTPKKNILLKIWDDIKTVAGLKVKEKNIAILDKEFKDEIQADIDTVLKHQRRIYDETNNKPEQTKETESVKQREETTSESLPEETNPKVEEINSRRKEEIGNIAEPLEPLSFATENYDQAKKEYDVQKAEYDNKIAEVNKKYDEEIKNLDEPKLTNSDFSKIDLSDQLGLNKAEKFLDDISKKLDDFGKETLGMNIPVTVLKGAVSAMKGAVKTAKIGADVISAGVNHVRGTEWYKKLSDSDKKEFESKGILEHLNEADSKKAVESAVKSETVGNKPIKTSVREVTGQTDMSDKKTISEKNLLKEKFKNLQRGYKTGVKETQQLKREFIDQLKSDIKGLGKEMNEREIKSLLNQVGKINEKNIDAVEKVIQGVIDRVENRQSNRELAGLKKQVKKAGRSDSKSTPRNIRDLAQNAGMIDERYLSQKSKDEYRDILSDVRDTFRPVNSDNYKMVDYDQAMSKLEKLADEVDNAKAEEIANNLGIDATGLGYKELLDLWKDENADSFAENLSEAKRKAVRDAFNIQGEYAKLALDGAETDGMTAKEIKALNDLKKIQIKDLPLETVKQFIKITDNIIVNKDFSNAGAITAKINADKAVKDLIGYIEAKGINPTKIDNSHHDVNFLGLSVPSILAPTEWIKHVTNDLTTLNVFMESIMGGSQSGAKLYGDSGFFELSNSRVKSVVRKSNFDDYYNNLVNKLHKTNPAITDGKEVVKRAIFGTLLQTEKESPESMEFFKKNYIEASVKSLEKYTNNSQAKAKIEILNKTLDDLKDVATKEELIDYLQTKEKDNFRLLKAASDYFMRHTQEFQDNAYFNHGERFDPMGRDDFYLPLGRQSLVPKSMREKLDEVKKSVDFMSYKSASATSGSIFTRKKNARLQESETINFDFDSFISNKYGEQVYDMESAQNILKLKSILTHPEMTKKFGSSLVELIDRAITKIAIDSGVAANSHSSFEKNIIKVERVTRKIGSIQALGGVDQYLKQYPSVLVGSSIRLGKDAGLLAHYMFMNKSQVELLKIPSIRLRAEAEAGTKRASDDIKFTSLNAKEKNDVQRIASELSKGVGIGIDKARELTMLSLRMGDVNAANTTFLAYYHSFLRKNGVKEADIDMRTEHIKVEEGDKVRNEALAYAQHMINTTQTSSDMSEGSKLATNPTVAAKLLSGIIIPFSTFSNNAMIRFMKAVGNIPRNPVENTKEAAASLTEILAFQSIKALALAPVAALIGKQLFGGDDDDEEDVVDWQFQATKAYSASLGDISPLPDSFDMDALNYMMYMANKSKLKEKGQDEHGEFTYVDYDKLVKKMQKTKDAETPFRFYRYGDQDGWDLANGVKSDIGLYEIPIKQAERTHEAWDVLTDNMKSEYNKYGKKEYYKFDDKYKNFLIFYTLQETATNIGFSDAFSRRIMEKRFDELKRASKEKKKSKKKGRSSAGESDEYKERSGSGFDSYK